MNIKNSIFVLTLFPLLSNTNVMLAAERGKLIRSKSSNNLSGCINAERKSFYKGNNNTPIENIRNLLCKFPPLGPHDRENDELMKKYIDNNINTLVGIKDIISSISDENIRSEICSEIVNNIVRQINNAGTFNELLFNALPDKYKLKFIEEYSNKAKYKEIFICDINNYLDRYNVDIKLKYEISKIVPPYPFIKQDIVNQFFVNRDFEISSFNILPDEYKKEFIIDVFIKSKDRQDSYDRLFVDLICQNNKDFVFPIRGIIYDLYCDQKIQRNKDIYNYVERLYFKFNFNKDDINMLKHILRNVYK